MAHTPADTTPIPISRTAVERREGTPTAYNRALHAAGNRPEYREVRPCYLPRVALRLAIVFAAGLLAGVGVSWLHFGPESKEAEERVDRLKARLAESEQAVARARFELESPSRRPGIDPVTRQPAQQTTVAAVGAAGEVVSIPLGSDDGVRVGFVYTVSRSSLYVGQIEITETRPKSSKGRSVRPLQRRPIQVGDDVSSK